MANSTTVRISQNVLDMLKQIASQQNSNIQQTLERAVEEYRRKILLQEANVAYQELKNSDGWKEELKEREAWDSTLSDDL